MSILSPLARYGLIALVAIGLLAFILASVNGHDQQLVDQGRQQVTAAVGAVTAKVQADQRAQAQRTADEQQENRREAQRMDDQSLMERRAADDAVRGLQLAADRSRAALAARAVAAAASAPGGLSQAGVVPADVYQRLVDRAVQLGKHARDLAEYADCLERGGIECAADYDALSK